LVWLVRAPILGSRNQVCRQIQLPQYISGPRCLIAGNAHPDAHITQRRHARPHVRIKITFSKPLWLARVRTPQTLSIETEARAEILECIPVIQPQGNDRTEYRREGMTRHAQPVSPGPVLPSLINQCLSDVKYYCVDHPDILQHA